MSTEDLIVVFDLGVTGQAGSLSFNYINRIDTEAAIAAPTITEIGAAGAYKFTVPDSEPFIYRISGSTNGVDIVGHGRKFIIKTAEKDEFITEASSDVWNKLTAGFTNLGSVGKLVADSLDTPISTRASGTTQVLMSAQLTRALGLMQENMFLDDTTYDAGDNLTAGRIRIYSLAASVGTTNNVIDTYSITAIWTSNVLTSYKQVRL